MNGYEILSAIDQLAEFPRMGRVVPEMADPDLRERIVGAFRIVNRHRGEWVELVTIFRGRVLRA